MKKLHAYGISPIDFNWEMVRTAADIVLDVAQAAVEALTKGPSFYESELEISDVLEQFDYAKALARECGWEGDFTEKPRLFWLPAEGGFEFGFVWKQSNSGQTFVISPYPLPWLDDISFNTAECHVG